MKRYIKSQYIPDLTERFPEGFGGVDLTSKYYPDKGLYPEYPDFSDEGQDILNAKTFEIGQKYHTSGIFTGQPVTYTVIDIEEDRPQHFGVTFRIESGPDIDGGSYTDTQTFEILWRDNGDEYVIYDTYKGHDLVIEAE